MLEEDKVDKRVLRWVCVVTFIIREEMEQEAWLSRGIRLECKKKEKDNGYQS